MHGLTYERNILCDLFHGLAITYLGVNAKVCRWTPGLSTILWKASDILHTAKAVGFPHWGLNPRVAGGSQVRRRVGR
jgi:hypothetical protein